MKKRGTAMLALALALLLAGCAGGTETGLDGGSGGGLPETGRSSQAGPEGEPVTYTGTVTARFTEGGGGDAAEVLAVELDSGETVYLTLLDSTDWSNGDDVSEGDLVTAESERYPDSGYHPALAVTLVREAPPDALQITSPDAPYARIRLAVPDGWQAEEWEFDLEHEAAGYCALALWPEDAPEFRIRLGCYGALGICGTGVTIEELTLPGGEGAVLYTEGGDTVWATLCWQDVPGGYAALYEGSRALWDQYRDEVLNILGGAELGVEGVVSETAAIGLAEGLCSFAYEGAYGQFDVVDGWWKVTFYGGNRTETFRVRWDGSETDDAVEHTSYD